MSYIKAFLFIIGFVSLALSITGLIFAVGVFLSNISPILLGVYVIVIFSVVFSMIFEEDFR